LNKPRIVQNVRSDLFKELDRDHGDRSECRESSESLVAEIRFARLVPSSISAVPPSRTGNTQDSNPPSAPRTPVVQNCNIGSPTAKLAPLGATAIPPNDNRIPDNGNPIPPGRSRDA